MSDPPTLDIMATTATVAETDTIGIYEGLFAIDTAGHPRPLLASGSQWSNDNLTLTVPLRTRVLFHNGSPMTADDVVASLQRWLRLGPMGQVSASAVKDIVAKDPHTVVIHLSRPLGLLPTYLTDVGGMPAIMPRSILDKYGDRPVQEWIGTGPFKFKEWKPGAYLQLVRWEKYTPLNEAPSGYAGRRIAYVDEVHVFPIPDPNTRLAGLKSGDFHINMGSVADQYAEVKGTSTLATAVVKPNNWLIFSLNKKTRMFTNLKLREAFRKAIDSKPIMEAAFGPQELWSISSPTLAYWAFEDNKTGAEVFNHQDVAGARALLKEAGYTGAPVVWLTSRAYDFMYKAALVAKSQLEAVGFKVDLQVIDWATLMQRRAQPEVYDVFQTGLGGSTNPLAVNRFVSSQWPGWWSNPKKDEAIQRFETRVTPVEQKAAWSDIQRLFYDDVVGVKVGDFYDYYGFQKRVQGFKPTGGPPPYWNVWLAG